MEAWELHTSSRAVQGYVSFAIVLCITLSRSLFFNIKLKKKIRNTVVGFQQF